MIGFWITAALLSAAASYVVVSRAAHLELQADGSEDPTLDVYRRQLREMDDLADRGLLTPQDHRSATTEAARRLLSAADQSPKAVSATPRARLMVFIIAAVLPLLAVGGYSLIGAPGVPDQSFASRLAQWRKTDPATLGGPELVAVLQQVVNERPTDPQPLMFLARVQAATGDETSAIRNLEAAIRLAPQRSDLKTLLGETLVLQAKGEVSAEALQAFQSALVLTPTDPSARYHVGRSMIARGDVAQGLKIWRSVLATLPSGDERAGGLRAELAEVVKSGGLPKPEAPEVPVGGADQAAFIRSMVNGLAARLKASPDDPAGWARLVRSYGVLGDRDAQAKALAEARRLYKDRPDLMKTIEDSAKPLER
jgi:cytochrome c-type biogenesis protein CcmH